MNRERDTDALLEWPRPSHSQEARPKMAAVQQLLTDKIRLSGFEKEWEIKRLKDMLTYERPDRYFVTSTTYSSQGDVPVLTANKAFILGYTDETFGICTDVPAIVFDDFTTDNKFVTFPFKVKSSAIKILRAKNNSVNLKYLFELIQVLRFPVGEHKRYYISEFQNIRLLVPEFKEQAAIATVLSDMDAQIAALDQLIAKKRDLKKAAMQQLLTGKTRLPGFEGEWEVKQLGDFAPLQRGFDLPNRHLQQGPHPVVYSNGVMNFHSAYQVRGPGVVTGRSGTIGKVTFVEENFWPHNTTLWVTSFNGCDPKFVYYLYGWIGLECFISGSGVPTLNRNDIHDFDLLIPPTENEQTTIAQVLSDIDAEIAALEQRRVKTKDIKQAMMQELLTGKTRLVPPRKSNA